MDGICPSCVYGIATSMLLRPSYWLSLAIFFVGVVHDKARVVGDADFESVRTNLDKPQSGKPGDSKGKYFRE